MQKIIALVIVLFGVGGGLALGVALRPGDAAPGPDDAAADAGSAEAAVERGGTESGAADEGEAGADRDYVKIGRQIIIPVVKEGETQALMLFDLALDVFLQIVPIHQAMAAGIHKLEVGFVDVAHGGDAIPGYTRRRFDNARSTPGKDVEQATFADVGPADDGDYG